MISSSTQFGSFIAVTILLAITFQALIWLNLRIFSRLLLKYDAPQRLHSDEVSRFGGFVMLLGFTYLLWSSSANADIAIGWKFLLAFAPLGVITLLEDLHLSIHPLIRLTVLILSSFLITIFTDIDLPTFDSPYLSEIFNNNYFRICFYSLCIATLINGMNFIDGTNGNLAFVSLSIFSNLLFLGLYTNDYDFIYITLCAAAPMLVFALFNYPWGKIFAGDFGAYLYGAIIGFLTIYFFGKHPDISSWNALLVIFYPCAELIYSIVRKVRLKESPFFPDRNHLHIKIYSIIFRGTKNSKLANNLVVLFLTVFWVAPVLILPWVLQSHFFLIIALLILSGIYIAMNIVIPSA